MQPLVSVIIPTYNSGKYLGRCLLAIEMQTYKNIEVIIVDAGSTDCTNEIIYYFSKQFVVKSYQLANSTQSEARNLGLEHATGKYISFCDSDDFYLADKISCQVEDIERNNADVSYFDVLHFYTDKRDKLFVNRHPKHDDMLAECIANQTINLNSVLVKTEFMTKHGLTFPKGEMGRYGEDGNFIFQLALHKARFSQLDKHLSVVEVRADSHTQWEAQWKMKYYSIQYLTNAKQNRNRNLNIEPHHLSALTQSIQKQQIKLIVALIIAGKYREGKLAITKLTSLPINWMFNLFLLILTILPKSYVHQMLTKLWVKTKTHKRQIYPTIDDSIRSQINLLFSINP